MLGRLLFLTALMFVRIINCSVSLNRGEGGYLATEETLFFEDQNGLHLLRPLPSHFVYESFQHKTEIFLFMLID